MTLSGSDPDTAKFFESYIGPGPRDLINQDNAAVQASRQEPDRKARQKQLDKIQETRFEQMHGIGQQRTDQKTNSNVRSRRKNVSNDKSV